ncbi:efflux RND transporter periplasmic adaptor subunit [Rodentibacter caecimuris]|uniref:Efflux transporter periplasmic adaptor subunit n=1 Tax=Rodentibacter caecimuris TaxID=1796644 RepID=A0ABX3KWY9_9PAST|nr:efflux transporter periplasmic adaptor subunit [Rodentibacter heylii]
MKKKIIIVSILFLAITAVTYFFIIQHNSQPDYLTESVHRGNLEQNVIASGSIESINEVDVGAQVSGKITKLYVTLGQNVKKGDMIASIDSTTQINNLNSKKAQLSSYQAQLNAKQTALNVAQSSFNRLNKLYQQKATSFDELNNAKNTLESARSEVLSLQESIKQAEIEVDTAQTNVDYTKITSPIDGTVISTPISEGQTVNSAQTTPTIVKVADLTRMRIKPEISEGDITKVKAGQAVSFSILSDNNTQYQAIINSVDPATTTISDNTSTSSSTSSSTTSAVYYYANIIVDNPDLTLRIGMTTENKIKIAEVKDVLLISTLALQKQQDKTFVDVLNGNKKERREVEVGIQNDFQTEIKSGLNEGDKVIISQVESNEKVGNSNRGPRIF